MSDDNLRQMVRDQFGIDIIEICNEMREKQDHILRAMKGADGVNIRHIARITGNYTPFRDQKASQFIAKSFVLQKVILMKKEFAISEKIY